MTRTLATIVAGLTLPVPAFAALITWGAAQIISGDSDVSTDGTLVYAYNFGTNATAPTINGVTFAAFHLPAPFTGAGVPVTVGAVSISESPGNLFGNIVLSGAAAPFSSLSTSYQALLGSGAMGGAPVTLSLVLGGLTAGQMYDFQWWSNDSSGAAPVSFTAARSSAQGEIPVALDPGFGLGGVGEYAIGRFTADGSSQTIAFSSLSAGLLPLINGFQLRQVQASVPAPSVALLALGGLALTLLWRRQRPA
jgi:hypothetical protein